MSRKKIYATVGFEKEVLDRLDSEADKDERSRSFILDKILRGHYALLRGEWEEEKVNADKA